MSSIATLFPRDVVTSDTEDPGDISDLLPSERRFVSNAVPKRIGEFAAGRRCARQAIARLGLPPVDLLVNTDRTVRWPSGLIGSITHTAGYCAVAVASSRDYVGIGLDVEQIVAAPFEVVPQICTEPEQAWLDTLPAAVRARLATLIFTAKECFYKCQYCLTGTWLDFKDIQVRVDAGDFFVVSKHPVVEDLQRKWTLRGRFMWCADRVVSAMVLEHEKHLDSSCTDRVKRFSRRSARPDALSRDGDCQLHISSPVHRASCSTPRRLCNDNDRYDSPP